MAFVRNLPQRKIGTLGLTFGTIIQQPGINFTPLWEHGNLVHTGDGYGTITAQPMTYTESKMGKSTTTVTQQIVDKQGHQQPTT